jgi:FkbM family methyltransferase
VDIIVENIMGNNMPGKKWTWIDIGAHNPTFLNNTAIFYKKRIYGINVEADPTLIRAFYVNRKKDINLNMAIADKSGVMDFYIMSSRTLNTLSAEEAHECEKLGYKIEKIIKVKTATVTEIIDKYSNGIFPDFMSLDAEGFDLQVLKTIEWEKTSPKVICVENVPFETKMKNYFESMQVNELSSFLKSRNYSIIAFTLINTIFVNNNFMEKG